MRERWPYLAARKQDFSVYADSWQQHDEWAFVRNLGNHRKQAKAEFGFSGPTRLELLKGYLEGLRLRTDWDGLNRAICIDAVEGEIRLEEAKRPS